MKNLIYFLVLPFIFSFPTISCSQYSVGLKGQINSISTPLVIKRDLLSKALGETLNPGFGISLEKKLNKYSSLQIELMYQEQSKSFLLTGSDRVINTSLMEYLRIPILIKYRIPFENWNLLGLIGPNLGYALDLKSGETDQNLVFTYYEKLNFDEHNIKRFDIGILAGIGIEKVLANNMKTTLSLRYLIGLTDIMENAESTFYNRGYALDMGFMIPLELFRKKEQQL